MTELQKAATEFSESLSAAIRKRTGADYGSVIAGMVDEEVRILLETARVSERPDLVSALAKPAFFHGERVAAVFGAATKNGKAARAFKRLWDKYWSAWAQMMVAKAFIMKDRARIEELLAANFGGCVSPFAMHAVIEKMVFGHEPRPADKAPAANEAKGQ